MRRAIFLDRDGVINEDLGYVGKREDFHFLPGVFEALRHFQNLGFLLIIVTNQSGIARGYYTVQDFLSLSEWMKEELRKRDITITDIFYCPHHPEDGCECRKPKPGMILEAARRYDIDLSASWMIGDKPSDIEAAKNAGIPHTILLDDNTLFDTIGTIQ